MEVVKQLCRLCSQTRTSAELMGEINDELLCIRQKLIDCCRWNTLEQLANEYFPKNTCITCVQRLESCWEFAESVKNAQYNLLNITNTIKTEPVEKDESMDEYDDTYDTNSNIVSIETMYVKEEITYEESNVNESAIINESMNTSTIETLQGIHEKNVESNETSEMKDELEKQLECDQNEESEICVPISQRKSLTRKSKLLVPKTVALVLNKRNPSPKKNELKMKSSKELQMTIKMKQKDENWPIKENYDASTQMPVIMEEKNGRISEQLTTLNDEISPIVAQQPLNGSKLAMIKRPWLYGPRKKKSKFTRPQLQHLDDDFLTRIRNEDRNDDGTINPDRIVELELENWLVLQYQCHVCHSCLGDYYKLKSHLIDEHPGEQIRHICNFCAKVQINHSVTRRHTLFNHIINFHLPHLKYSCWKCNKFYWDLDKMHDHVTGHKSLPNQKELTGTLCDICGKTFEHESALRMHSQSHLPPKLKPTYECFLCHKTFSLKLSLNYHMSHHFKRPKFKCETCSKEFNRKDLLKRHTILHLDIFPFSCQDCGKKFKHGKTLESHVRIHTGERPYLCNICNFSCSDCGNICKHIRQKHGIVSKELKQHYRKKVKHVI